MAKTFGENERRICSLFTPGTSFNYRGLSYTVKFADKPVCSKGEPKTDIFIRTETNDSLHNTVDFKISYKKDNADFIENKTSAERAEQLLGANWKDIICESTTALRENFENRAIVYMDKFRRTEAGSITLGWKFELLRVPSGDLSGEMILTHQQKRDVYAGTNLVGDKRNATVAGKTIPDSGIAEYIFEEITPAATCQDVIDNMQTIDEFLELYPKVYYACKALNYRTLAQKYDGARPLSVFIEWNAVNGKLEPTFVYDKPLITRGDVVCNKLLAAMKELSINNTNDLTPSNTGNNVRIHR